MEWLAVITGFFVAGIVFVVFFGAPYVPTLQRDRKDILAVRPLRKNDVFVDLGSGDGAVLRMVAPYCRRATGIELSPWLVLVSRLLSRKHRNIHTMLGSIWHVPLPAETTVVYTFFNGKYIPRIEKKVQAHASSQGRSIDMITFGFQIEGRTPIKTIRAMHLYRIDPLQK